MAARSLPTMCVPRRYKCAFNIDQAKEIPLLEDHPDQTI